MAAFPNKNGRRGESKSVEIKGRELASPLKGRDSNTWRGMRGIVNFQKITIIDIQSYGG